jgi:hypothetical protein
VDVLTEQLATLGYTGGDVHAAPVENSVGARMYHLVFASKDKHGDRIWNSVAKKLPKQPSLF